MMPFISFLLSFSIFAQNNAIVRNPEVATRISLLEVWMESQMLYNDWPGISIGIVYDQELMWSKGFGYANLEQKIPATTNTIYRIASISKLFTSIAIMKLHDEEKLSIHDSVAKHLSWFKIKNIYHDAPVITIQHLLTHTSGIPNYADIPGFCSDSIRIHYTFDRLLYELCAGDLEFEPGSDIRYSNFNYVIL